MVRKAHIDESDVARDNAFDVYCLLRCYRHCHLYHHHHHHHRHHCRHHCHAYVGTTVEDEGPTGYCVGERRRIDFSTVAAGPSRFVTKFRKGRNCDRDGAPHSNVGEAFGESRGEAGERHHGGAGGDQLGGCVRS
ncbi:hypothetical protein G5I_01332 [Acromyrmex echinatior]|uniref:Uncharacterized protein n=1 Tax=Acromyrmex echinatior TaxID=103372 RepID=F4W7B7_ACREC|nr:hypothetical protein G5I_01332 [Acromyrmex echinatior]